MAAIRGPVAGWSMGGVVFQFPVPVQDHIDWLRHRRLLYGSDHDESLAIWCHIVPVLALPLEEHPRHLGRGRLRIRKGHGHHPGLVTIEKLVSAPGPDGCLATCIRDL